MAGRLLVDGLFGLSVRARDRRLTLCQILLVRKHEQQTIFHFPIIDDAVQLLPRLVHPGAIARIDNEDQALRPAEVVSPQRPDLVLATDVPDVELDVLVGDGLDVEADCGDGGDILAELELIEDGGLSGGVESEHEETHLLGSEDLTHHFAELAAHGEGECCLRGGCEGRGRCRKVVHVGLVVVGVASRMFDLSGRGGQHWVSEWPRSRGGRVWGSISTAVTVQEPHAVGHGNLESGTRGGGSMVRGAQQPYRREQRTREGR